MCPLSRDLDFAALKPPSSWLSRNSMDNNVMMNTDHLSIQRTVCSLPSHHDFDRERRGAVDCELNFIGLPHLDWHRQFSWHYATTTRILQF